MNTLQSATGKWQSILRSVGVPEECLTGKHSHCPTCGGKDRFRFANQDGRGTWFCNQCEPNHGDGMDLYMKVTGLDFKEAAQEIDGVSPKLKPAPLPIQEDLEAKRKRLNNMRKRVKPINASKSVIDYLINRGISKDTIEHLTNRIGVITQLEYWSGKSVAHRFDAMVGKVTKCHKPITYHVTYTNRGQKANVSVARKLMPTIDKFDHGVVELFDHSHELGVAEGIETAMSAYELFKIPTWAALTAKSLENFVIPEGVTKIYVFGDNDSGSMTGQRSARKLVERAKYQGLEVVESIPITAGFDWNDVLIEELKRRA